MGDELAVSLFIIFIMLFASESEFLLKVADDPIWQGQIPYDCAYLDGTVYEKIEFAEPVNGQYHALMVNITVDYNTSYNVGITTTEILYDFAEVGGQYNAYTCKMADVHDMIDRGELTFLP